jgi:hypothetical protein
MPTCLKGPRIQNNITYRRWHLMGRHLFYHQLSVKPPVNIAQSLNW